MTSANSKGTFHMYIAIYALLQLFNAYHKYSTDSVSVIFAFLSLVMAATKLRVFVLSVVFGIIMIPLTLGFYVALVWFDCCDAINPKKDTFKHNAIKQYWMRVAD